MKKGMTGEIFKYIFVLVAGAFILVFFVRFAFMHAGSSESMISVKAVTSLNDNLDAFAISPNADTNIDLGYEANLKFNPGLSENKGFCGTIAVGDSSPLRNNKIIFSPKELNGRYVNAWTQSWRFPFKVGNFYYLNNDKNRVNIGLDSFDILSPSSTDRIPERFKFSNSGGSKTVIFDDCTGFYDICIVKHTNADCGEGSDYECYGVVFSFGKQLPFLGKAMLYGAIFAEDYNSYECSLKLALERLKFMLELYKEKDNAGTCSGISSFISDFTKRDVEEILNELESGSYNGDAETDAKTLYDYAYSIRDCEVF